MPHWELLEDVFFLVNSYRIVRSKTPINVKEL